MHGTAMNMAKKQHKVAEGKFTSELTRQLQLEVLNMQQRRAIGMRMRRLAQKIARTKARKKKRMKTNDQLKTKAMKQARAILFKKMSGGKAASELAMGARIAIGKKLRMNTSFLNNILVGRHGLDSALLTFNPVSLFHANDSIQNCSDSKKISSGSELPTFP